MNVASRAHGKALLPPVLAIAVTALLALDLAAGDGLWFEYTGTLGFAHLGAHSLVVLADLFLRRAELPPDRRLLTLWCACSMTDIDGDGVPDLAVGGADYDGDTCGRIVIYSGASAAVIKQITRRTALAFQPSDLAPAKEGR